MIKNREKVIQIVDTIFLYIICLCIVISAFLIGTPLTNNYAIINCIINVSGLAYIVFNLIIKKNKSVNWLNIILLVVLLSSIIPLVANSFVSLSATVDNIFNIITIIALVILISQNSNINKSKYITNSIMISGLIISFISIDNLTTNFLTNFLEKIGNIDTVNPDSRQIANFGYANSLAVYLAFCFILSISKSIEDEKKYDKYLYSFPLTIFLSLILLSYSRGTWIALAIIILAYIIFINGKGKKIELTYTIFIAIITSVVFSKLYGDYISSKNYLLIYLTIIVLSVINSAMQIVRKKLSDKICKIKTKTIIISIVIFGMICIAIFVILMQYKSPLVLFKENDDGIKSYTQEIDYITSDNLYKVEIDINAVTKFQNADQYKIIIIERNKYKDLLKEHEISLGNFQGTKVVEFKKQPNTAYLAITYETNNLFANQGLTIYSLKINNQEAELDYKYIPKEIAYKLKSINTKVLAVSERTQFWKDGIKLFLEKPLTGFGGKAWKYMQYTTQEYFYFSEEVHSYIVNSFIENGILGGISTIAIYVYAFIIFIKNRKDNKILPLILAVGLVLGHSVIDFDMSFAIIRITVFAVLALCAKEINMKRWTQNIMTGVFAVILCISSLFTCMDAYSETQYLFNIESKANRLELAERIYNVYPLNLDILEYILSHEKNIESLNKFVEYLENYEPYYNLDYIIRFKLENNQDIYDEVVKSLENKPMDIENMVNCYQYILQSDMNSDEKYIILQERIKEEILENIDKPEYRINEENKAKFLERIIVW